jgi:preprotein translocase subunit SecG
MLYVLLALVILACILLVFIILAQNPKGGGTTGVFGSTATQILGARQGADFLEKATWYFGIGILVVVGASYFLTSGPSAASVEKPKISNALEYPVGGMTPSAAPGTQAPPAGQKPAPVPQQPTK